jgi:hypothetical protein
MKGEKNSLSHLQFKSLSLTKALHQFLSLFLKKSLTPRNTRMPYLSARCGGLSILSQSLTLSLNLTLIHGGILGHGLTNSVERLSG